MPVTGTSNTNLISDLNDDQLIDEPDLKGIIDLLTDGASGENSLSEDEKQTLIKEVSNNCCKATFIKFPNKACRITSSTEEWLASPLFS